VEVSNTIFSTGPGFGLFTTRHNLFSANSRKWLFEGIELGHTPVTSEMIPARGGLANGVLEQMVLPRPPIQAGSEGFFIRTTGRYWFPALPFTPPVLDANLGVISSKDTRVKFVSTDYQESPKLAVAILAGKIGYLWWSAIGDEFDFLPSQTVAPRTFISGLWKDKRLLKLAEDVELAGRNAFFASNSKGALYVNIRWTSERATTDVFDRFVLEKLGLLGQWRNLNIWYRQVMRSSGENANSVVLSSDVVLRAIS
jgi:hypothetical protein